MSKQASNNKPRQTKLTDLNLNRRRQKPPDLHDDRARSKDEDEILRQFDLSQKYGACCGITRMKRWERANKFQLDPPQIVKEILQRYPLDHDKNRCIWVGKV